MKRGQYHKVIARNEKVTSRIKAIKCDHPFWGYRRVWAHLNFIDGITINKKRVYRLMQEHQLLVKPNHKLRAKRRVTTSKPRPVRPNHWWGIDMTKVMIEGVGWQYVVIVIDWYTKKVVGHYSGAQSKSWHWLAALNMAANKQCADGTREYEVHLMSDNGCQPTSQSFIKACASMGIKQAFTSYNNPKGNADTERFMRTLKEELVWINEWTSPKQFNDALDKWINYYNNHYLHSTLNYQTPTKFEQSYEINNNPNTPLKIAS